MGQFVSMTAAEFRALLTKNTGSSPTTPSFAQKTSKYRSEKAKADEKTFDSRKERNRYLELKKQQENGLIWSVRSSSYYRKGSEIARGIGSVR